MKYFFSLVCAVLLSLSAFSQGSYIYFAQGGGGSRPTAYGYSSSVTISAGWVTATTNLLNLQWTVAANTSTTPRTATITGSEKNSLNQLVPFNITIKQSGAVPTPPPPTANPCSGFIINGPIDLTPGVDTYFFSFNTNAGTGTWSITSGGPASIVAGQGTNQVAVYTDPNVSNGIRLSVTTSKGCTATFFCIPI